MRTKYRPVLSGFNQFGFTDDMVKTREGDFELAMQDLEACRRCKAQRVALVESEQEFVRDVSTGRVFAETVQVYRIEDCRSSFGNGWYYDLSWEGCCVYGRPAFTYKNCSGPVNRLRQIQQRNIYKGGYKYFSREAK